MYWVLGFVARGRASEGRSARCRKQRKKSIVLWKGILCMKQSQIITRIVRNANPFSQNHGLGRGMRFSREPSHSAHKSAKKPLSQSVRITSFKWNSGKVPIWPKEWQPHCRD